MALSFGTSDNHATLLTALTEFILGDHVATVAINAGGSSFAANDTVTLTDGTFTRAATFLVTTVSGGAITGLRIIDSGAYSVDPDLSASTSWSTSGSGTGATFDMTMEVSNWVKIKDDATLDGSTERVVFFQETTNDVFIGFRSYTRVTGAQTAKNWVVLGMTSYNGGLPWYQQPDLSPGVSSVDGSVPTTGGTIFLAKGSDAFDMDYWFHVSNRRVIAVAKLRNATITTPRYSTLYAGLLNPFGSNAEFPYPLFIAGCTNADTPSWNDVAPAFPYSGIGQLIGITGRFGPGQYWHNDGSWKSVINSGMSSVAATTRGGTQDYVLYPFGKTDPTSGPDVQITIDNNAIGVQWGNIIQRSTFAAADFELRPTPDSGSLGAKRMMVPLTLVLSNDPDVDLAGELDGVYFVSAAGSTLITPEDQLDDGSGNKFYVFPNGSYQQIDGFMAIRQD
jgi:hypothetical protein